SSRRRHTRSKRDWSSDVCSSDLALARTRVTGVHLKTLTLRGFKSFASATTLHLEPGITCVVGPNGSGKSNVVDALAWVMGEQGRSEERRGGNEGRADGGDRVVRG